MTFATDKIDAAPLDDDDFSFSFNSWVSVTIDSLNEIIIDIEGAINGIVNNGLIVPSYTQSQIITLSATAANGTLWYCVNSSPPNLVAKINGSLVQFTTTAFP